jgi:predicted phage terminase large subunit-like protein
VVLSIDPGQTGGPGNSFSVIQAWCSDGGHFFLIDQWREQCHYRDLRSACKAKFLKRYRPSAVIIELTGQGPALYSDIQPKSWMKLITVTPRDSKIGRLAEHLDLIEAGRIFLPEEAEWREEFIEEFELFPKGEFTDQIDATTQYLDYMSQCPPLMTPPQRAIAAISSHSSSFVAPSPRPRRSSTVEKAMGAIAVRSSRWR